MGRKKLKPDFTEEELGINPFVAGTFKIDVVEAKFKRKVADVTDIIENPDSVITNIQEQTYTQLLEKETYCKVFNRAGYRLHINSLTPKAKSLFLWLQYEIKPSKDYIFINEERYMLETNTSYNTYKTALDELFKAGVLALTTFSKLYWVNPLFLFTGNRLKKYPENLNFI